MKNRTWMLLSFFVASGLSGAVSSQGIKDNPFLQSWESEPYRIPPFSKIKDSDYLPALEEGIRRQDEAIEKIVANRQEADFANTILALEESSELIDKVAGVLFNVAAAHTNDSLRDIEAEAWKMLSRQTDKVYMNPFLFRRVKRMKESKVVLDEFQQRLLDETYRMFVRHGAELDPKAQERLSEVNLRLSELENKFSQNLLLATADYSLVVEDVSRLSGLSQDDLARAKERAEEKGVSGYLFGLDNPTIMPFLQYVAEASLRKEILDAYTGRCRKGSDYDNTEVVAEILALRMEKARLLGYPDYASYQLEDRMAKSPEAVYSLFETIWPAALRRAKQELTQIRKLARKEGFKGKLIPSDWRYYAARYQKGKYDWNDEEVKAYFSIDAVRDGIFDLCRRLYGISFEKLEMVEVPTPNTSAYLCRDNDSTVLGVLYLDMIARPGYKSGGAWNTTYVEQAYDEKGKRLGPVTSIVCNFASAVEDKPTLLSIDETETFFHEFGHALHALFSDVRYKGLSQVPRDFVELPSQIMENWAMHPQMLRQYARHYRTGEAIPDSLIEKAEQLSLEGQGFAMTELLAAAWLDMDYHTMKSMPEDWDAERFEKDFSRKTGLIPEIYPRYKTLYFAHTMGGGYSAGYYSYIWSEVLDSDAFGAFEESGDIFDSRIAENFRRIILQNGDMYDAMWMYEKFRGHKPQTEALLKRRGLL